MHRRLKFNFMRDVVDGTDTVPTGGLPPELVGKTPAEIAQYYADRESTILENARRMVNDARANNPPTPPVPPTTPQFVTQEQLRNLTDAARQGLVNMAIMTASAGKADWNRLLSEVKKIVEALPPESAINSAIWEEAYFNVRGRMTDVLVTEARNRAMGLEPPSPPPPANTPPRVFTEGELHVIEGCGITTEMYADAEKKLTDGFQPFTIDNRRVKVTK